MIIQSDEISLAVGEEILSIFLEQKLMQKLENIKSFQLYCLEGALQIIIEGEYLSFKGKVEILLKLIDFSGDLMRENTLIFEIIPQNSLSHIIKTTIKMFEEKLKPAIIIDKKYMSINLYRFFEKWKPESASWCNLYHLKDLKIEEKNISFILIHKRQI